MNDQTDELNTPDIHRPEKAPKAGALYILLVLIVIAAAIEAAAIISRYISPESYYDYAYDAGWEYDDYLSGTDAWERGDIEYLSDDEVKAAGTACTELEHFDFSAESLLDELSDIFEDAGLGVASEEITSYNQLYGDGGSWYETLLTFYLDVPGDDTTYQRLTLNYDTATGALHEIDIFLSDEDCLIKLTEAILSMLDERSGDLYKASAEFYDFEDGYSVYIGREQVYGELE